MSKSEAWLKDKDVRNWLEQIKAERTKRNHTRDSEIPRMGSRKHRIQNTYSDNGRQIKTPNNYRFKQAYTLGNNTGEVHNNTERLKGNKSERQLCSWAIHGFQRTVMSFFSKNGEKLIFSAEELAIEPCERAFFIFVDIECLIILESEGKFLV